MNPVITPSLVTAFLTGICGPVLGIIIKHYLDKRKEELDKKKIDPVKEAAKNHVVIDNKLDELIEKYDADRVWIAQFHNGGHFYPTGQSIQKFTIFYETVSLNTQSIRQNFQSIPISLFSKSINRLVDNEHIAIIDFKDETVATYGLKYIAEETGCKSGYLFAIKSIDGKFIGILGLDYTKRKNKLTDDEMKELDLEARSIGGYIIMNIKEKNV
jgi:hypothetical protein